MSGEGKLRPKRRNKYLKSWQALRRKRQLVMGFAVAAAMLVFGSLLFASATLLGMGAMVGWIAILFSNEQQLHECPSCGGFLTRPSFYGDRVHSPRLCSGCDIPVGYVPPEKPEPKVYR